MLQSAPPAPAMPNLASYSDSGVSSSDDITNINTPTFFGTAQANSTVKLYRAGSILIGTGTANVVGQWTIAVSAPLSDGTHSITATATDNLGSTSDPSAALNVTIDTTAPGAGYGGQTPVRGDGTMNFTIVYTDGGSGMDVGSFDSSDITVTGPNGYNATATFISVDVGTDGSPRTVTYQIPAPAGPGRSTTTGRTPSSRIPARRAMSQEIARRPVRSTRSSRQSRLPTLTARHSTSILMAR